MSWQYLIRRLAQLAPTVAAILLTGFLLLHLAPGDPVLALAGENGDAAYYAAMRERFGLDQSIATQLATYASNVLRGDLGTSYVQGRPVAQLIAERLPATLLLTGSALLLSSTVGVVIGTFTATRHGRWPDLGLNAAALAVYAAPVFLVGQVAILLLALRTGWFPVQGMSAADSDATGAGKALDVSHHLALPAATLASQEIAVVARLTRAGLVDELDSDYVRTARAKGVTERAVLYRHALRRPLLPVVTVLGGRVGHLFSGAVLVEAVFGWPGIGRLLVSAIQTRDAPVVLGIFLLVAISVVVANLVTDIVYVWLDPRVRYR